MSSGIQATALASPAHDTRRPPLVIEARRVGETIEALAAEERLHIEDLLVEHGAILFRGFAVPDAEAFRRAVRGLAGEPLPYIERSSPRTEVAEGLYTSTDYPPEQSIFPHNEHSYADVFPRKLFFYCAREATSGGETPLADCRRVLARLPAALRARFQALRYAYVRNFGLGFGLPWQVAFQTDDPRAVERHCVAHDIEYTWLPDGGLRTRQVRDAIIRHPRTGALSWFNHATFFNVSTLPRELAEALTSMLAPDELPNQTTYGDGTPIEPEVLDLLREAYLAECVPLSWRRGDVVMIDNLLTAHARAPFTGPRLILFAMAEQVRRAELPPLGEVPA